MFDNTTLKLNVDPLILSALREDITSEDVSANAVMRNAQMGEVQLIAKEDGVICGLQVFERVFTLIDNNVTFEASVTDGDEIKKGQLLAILRGDIRTLLCGERTALNYLQRMSGVATYTRSVANLLKGTKTTLLDTRKTTPNNRIFEKYSVRIGGGKNHRYNLSDGVLLKDNHIGAAGSVTRAIELAKEYAPFVRKIEVEVETIDMVKEAVSAGADIIMLDNMTTESMEEAIKIINGKAEIEVSGNVTKENISKLTKLGVDYISSGALTHSAPILDLSLKKSSHYLVEVESMNTIERREQILKTLETATEPISGTTFANNFSVSRQVIVQDIAVLRSGGIPIISAHNGYILKTDNRARRIFKVYHTDEQTQEELNLFVDLGGKVEDVFVYHKAYGLIRGVVNIKSRRDVELYVENLTSGKSSELKNITSNYHYHTVTADDVATLDMIQEKLKEKGFLAQLTDYEPL